MAKNVLILSSSPIKGGNSDTLCDRFAAGAVEAGHKVEKIRVAEKKIGYCIGCHACQKGACWQKDDAPEIINKMIEADVIVLATPVYFYTMCAQLKALIDRSVMVFPRLQNKTFYYIMTMADSDKSKFNGTIEALRGFLVCCGGSTEAGIIGAAGVYQKGEIAGKPELDQAFEAGRSL